jgi:acylphosphatase
MSTVTRRLRLFGRVQGVFFRESMCREAAALGVRGWVRNCTDGSVEAMVQGEAAQVEALIAWARRGPPQARVERLQVEPATGNFEGFLRLSTADCPPPSAAQSPPRQ